MPLHDFPLRLAIVQMGMVSAIGTDLETSCATARSDLSRCADLPYVIVGANNVRVPATGHQVLHLTRGFRGDARLARLLTGALEDLTAKVPRDLWPPSIDVYVATPATFRDDPEVKIDPLSSPWESAQPTPEDFARSRSIVKKAMAAARVPSAIAGVGVIAQGHASVGLALEAAALSVHEGRRSLALILAVDSSVDRDRVASLDARGRLKGPRVPTGASPGEASACMLVASPDLLASREIAAIGYVLQPQSLESTPTFNAGAPPDGRTLAALASATVRGAPGQEVWCIADMNGEVYRAREWGMVIVHMNQTLPAVNTANVWLPAMYFGDTGAVTGLAATALAVRSFARRYAPAKSALVLSAADGSTRTAFA